jgi:hypothetical protein
MGNSPSSSPKQSDGLKYTPSNEVIDGSKVTFVYDDTPALIYRPASYKVRMGASWPRARTLIVSTYRKL